MSFDGTVNTDRKSADSYRADIAGQLVLKWSRLERGTPIHVSDDFTRLALDTLALCAMGVRNPILAQNVLS